MHRLADLLTQRQDRDSLPRPEPEVFTGNPLRYPNWIKSFETLIERKMQNPSEHLYYLGKYTTGEAKEAISGVLALDNTSAYSKARQILTDRFGNPFIVADAYRRKINGWPKIPLNIGQGLRKFSDFLQHYNTAMNTIQFLNVLNNPDENQRMVKKLPSHVVLRWNRVVDEWLAEDDPEECDFVARSRRRAVKAGYPPFALFCEFTRKEARIACNPVTSLQALRTDETKEKFEGGGTKYPFRDKNIDARALATFSSRRTPDADEECTPSTGTSKQIVSPFCKDNHELDVCAKFLKIPLTERRTFAQANALCWGCLKWGHIYKECRGRKTCRTCSRRHPTSLHDGSITQDEPSYQVVRESSRRNPVCHSFDVHSTSSNPEPVAHSLIVPVWLHHQDSPDSKFMVYALLDDQSDACFIKQTALDKLGIESPEVNLKLSTVLAEEEITTQKINGLIVRGVSENTEISLPRTYSRDIIPAKRSQIPTIPDKKVGTASKLSPPPTYNVDNRVIFSLFVGRNAIFSNID